MWLQNFPKQVILLLLKSMKEQLSMELPLVEQLVLFLLVLFPPAIGLKIFYARAWFPIGLRRQSAAYFGVTSRRTSPCLLRPSDSDALDEL